MCEITSNYWSCCLRPHMIVWFKHSIGTWWRHQMETFSALLAICAGNSPVPGEFPAQRPVTRGFDVFFDLRLNKRLGKQSWGWWFETLSRPLWRHRNGNYWSLYRGQWQSLSHSKRQANCLLLRLWNETWKKFISWRDDIYLSVSYTTLRRAVSVIRH